MVVNITVVSAMRSGLTRLDDFVRSLAAAGIGRALAASAVLTMNWSVIRSVGATEAGYFLLGVTVVTMMSAIARLGTDQVMVRVVGASIGGRHTPSRDLGRVVPSTMAIVAASGTVAALAMLTLALVVGQSSAASGAALTGRLGAIATLAFAIPAVGVSFFTGFVLQGLDRPGRSALFQGGLIAAVLAAVAPLASDLVGLTRIYLLTSWLVAAFGCWTLWALLQAGGHSPTFERRPAQAVIAESRPLLVMVAFSEMQMWGAHLMGVGFLDGAELAQVAVGQRVAMGLMLVGGSISVVLTPRLSRLAAEGDDHGFEAVAQRGNLLGIVLGVPLASAIGIAASPIMSFLGVGGGLGPWVLRIALVGQVVNLSAGALGPVLVAKGFTRRVRDAALVGGITSLVVVFIATSWLGAVGVILGPTVGLTVRNTVLLVVVKRRLGFFAIGRQGCREEPKTQIGVSRAEEVTGCI